MIQPSHFARLLIVFAGYWMAELYAPFLQNMLIAALLATATREIFAYSLRWARRPLFAALLTTFVMFLLFFAPIGYFVTHLATYVQTLGIEEIRGMLAQAQTWLGSVSAMVPGVEERIGAVRERVDLALLAEQGLKHAATFGVMGASFFKDLLLILVFYFFCLLYGERMLRYVATLIPLREDDLEELFYEVSSVMGVVFYSIVTVATLEGILFGIITAIFGYDGVFLGILYGFSSLIPLIGGIILWIPVALYEATHGSTANAVIILVYSVVVISIVADTFVKPWIIGMINKKVIKSPASINELLIFFSILAGLATFGFWGMILGPAITSLFVSVLRLYANLSLIQGERKREE